MYSHLITQLLWREFARPLRSALGLSHLWQHQFISRGQESGEVKGG